MKEWLLPIVLALIGSGAFFSFLQWLIMRRDAKKGAVTVNLTRLQLMLLMADYPDKVDEILEQAKYYFCVLNGDTYITALFKDWLKKKGIKITELDWFVEHLRKRREPMDD